MTPFIIVADVRTGSTLLSSSLNRHPQIRCYGELFHSQDLPDNQLEGRSRRTMTAAEMISSVFSAPDVAAAGFRAMIFLPLPDQPQWSDAWARLQEVKDLHVIELIRQDRLAQYASAVIAESTGVYHPYDNDRLLEPENRPTIIIDPNGFREWIEERGAMFDQRRRQLAGKPTLRLTYEQLTGDWLEEIRRVQQFLGAPPLALEQNKRKQETRPLSEVVANYDELRAAALV